MNLYADVGHFRRMFVGSSALEADDAAGILRMEEAASREIDNFCDRHFYDLTTTLYLDGNGRDLLFVPDLLTITSVKLDLDGDGVYEVELTDPTDYWPIRYGANGQDNAPVTALRLNLRAGSRSTFPAYPRAVEIIGSSGYTSAVERVPASLVVDDPLAAGAVTLNVTAATGDELYEEGQTLLLDSEQVYLTAINNDALTIVRGVNGTTDAAHVQTTVIDRYTYIPEVVEAALIQSGRLWKRRETAYSTVIQDGIGTIEVFKGLDPDVRMLLTPVKRIPV